MTTELTKRQLFLIGMSLRYAAGTHKELIELLDPNNTGTIKLPENGFTDPCLTGRVPTDDELGELGDTFVKMGMGVNVNITSADTIRKAAEAYAAEVLMTPTRTDLLLINNAMMKGYLMAVEKHK